MRAIVLTVLACGTLAWAQQPTAPTPPPAAGVLAIQQLAGASVKLQVSSPAFQPGGAVPVRHSDYGEKVSPELRWSAAPAGAKSLVLMMEDPDAREPKPFVHWLLYNLPPSTRMVPEALPGTPRLPQLGGALQGQTSRGNVGYFGPRPPKVDPPHHYHFQVFALDAMLTLDPAANRAALLEAMKGHVVASGELTGTFKAPAAAK